jgi:hypothetical protein
MKELPGYISHKYITDLTLETELIENLKWNSSVRNN